MAEAKSIANIGRATPNTSNRKITEKVAAKIFKKMEETGDIKSRVANRPVYGMTGKGLAKAAVSVVEDHPAASVSEVAQARLEEKNKIKQDAGLKVNTAQGPASKAELHVGKINMELALDKSGVEALDMGLPESTTAGYKKNVKAAVSATEHKTPAGDLGLAPSFSIPHPVAPKGAENISATEALPPKIFDQQRKSGVGSRTADNPEPAIESQQSPPKADQARAETIQPPPPAEAVDPYGED